MTEQSMSVTNLTPVVNGVPVNITVASIRGVRALCFKAFARVITPAVAAFPAIAGKSYRKKRQQKKKQIRSETIELLEINRLRTGKKETDAKAI